MDARPGLTVTHVQLAEYLELAQEMQAAGDKPQERWKATIHEGF